MTFNKKLKGKTVVNLQKQNETMKRISEKKNEPNLENSKRVRTK